LRALKGGLLKTSNRGLLLPYNENGILNGGGNHSHFFLAGDVRVNEQSGLVAMHTLLVREHNRLCKVIKKHYEYASDEEIYQLARKIVGAEMQIITYAEYLPALLGEKLAPKLEHYKGYNPSVDPRISNEFSTIIYRYGHTMVSSELKLANQKGVHGSVTLRDIFFKPDFVDGRNHLNIDYLIGGFFLNQAQELVS
jgi:peroxidase